MNNAFLKLHLSVVLAGFTGVFGKLITLNELSELKSPVAPSAAGMPLRNEETEKQQIIEALKQTGYNKSRAAQLLGIDRKTLYNKLKLYGIEL